MHAEPITWACGAFVRDPQLLRMHLLENVRVRVEAGHIDYVNELRCGGGAGAVRARGGTGRAVQAGGKLTVASHQCPGSPGTPVCAACELAFPRDCLRAAAWAPSCSWASRTCWSRRSARGRARPAQGWPRCRPAWRRCRSACGSTTAASCRWDTGRLAASAAVAGDAP